MSDRYYNDEEISDALASCMGIKISCKYLGLLGGFDPKDAPMDHWSVSLKTPLGKAGFKMRMGQGHKGKAPDLRDCLHSMVMDAQMSQQSEQELSSDFDLTAKRAREVRRGAVRMAAGLERLLGPLGAPVIEQDWEGFHAQALERCMSGALAPERALALGWALQDPALMQGAITAVRALPTPHILRACQQALNEKPIAQEDERAASLAIAFTESIALAKDLPNGDSKANRARI